jgi:hypothetical protein
MRSYVKDKSNRDYDIDDYGAIEQSDGSYLDRTGVISWFNDDGEWHREEGPALIFTNGDVEWYLNDTSYIFHKWCIELNKTDEAKMMLRLQYG